MQTRARFVTMGSEMMMAAVMAGLVPCAVQAYEVNAKAGTVTVSSVKDFEVCQREAGDADWCLNGLTTYVKSHPNVAFAAAKSARARFNHWVALRFFATALNKPSPAQCADDDLRLAVISGLGLPSDDPNSELAAKIAAGPCWSALQTPVQRGFADGGEVYRKNACALLKDKGTAEPECAPKAAAQPTAAEPPRSARLAGLRVESLATDPSTAASFRGEDDEQILTIRAKAPYSDVVLLKFKGVQGPWNNSVIPCVERMESDAKKCFAYVNGRDWTVMISEDGTHEVHPKGYDYSISVYRERLSDRSKELSSTDVAKEFSSKK